MRYLAYTDKDEKALDAVASDSPVISIEKQVNQAALTLPAGIDASAVF